MPLLLLFIYEIRVFCAINNESQKLTNDIVYLRLSYMQIFSLLALKKYEIFEMMLFLINKYEFCFEQ